MPRTRDWISARTFVCTRFGRNLTRAEWTAALPNDAYVTVARTGLRCTVAGAGALRCGSSLGGKPVPGTFAVSIDRARVTVLGVAASGRVAPNPVYQRAHAVARVL